MQNADRYLFEEELYDIRSKVAVVIPCGWNELTKSETTLLNRILNAPNLHLSPSKVKIVTQSPLNLSDWKDKPSKVISFGSTVNGIALYDPVEAGGTTLMASASLGDLEKNENAKQLLWTALKKMFSV